MAAKRTKRSQPYAASGNLSQLVQRAAAAHRSGDLPRAERMYRRLISLQPKNPDLHTVLGTALLQQRRLSHAASAYSRAVSLDQADPQRRADLVRAHRLADQLDDAVAVAKTALTEVQPHSELLEEAARVHLQAGEFDEAVGLARRALRLHPGNAEAHRTLGGALTRQHRHPEAIASLEQAVQYDPGLASASYELGLVHFELGDLEAAADAITAAVRLVPAEYAFLSGLAMVRNQQGRFVEAVDLYQRMLEQRPGSKQLLYNQSFPLLGMGELDRGWRQYAHGFEVGSRKPDRQFAVPAWEGPDSDTGRLLVWREQGVGDDIRLASCLNDTIRSVGQVVVETDPRLISLYARSFPDAEIRAEHLPLDPNPDYDRHCPTHDLPRHVRSDVGTYRVPGGWLTSDPDRVARLEPRIDELAQGRLRVGICWRSMRLETRRLLGYTTLDEWDPVLTTEDVELFNLQYGDRNLLERELDHVHARLGTRVHHFDDLDYTDDFEGVAALMNTLDVVVSVGTSVAVLAAALGRPLLYLIPEKAMLQFGEPDEPWMPSARVLSRRMNESWARPMEAAARLLRERVAAKQPAV